MTSSETVLRKGRKNKKSTNDQWLVANKNVYNETLSCQTCLDNNNNNSKTITHEDEKSLCAFHRYFQRASTPPGYWEIDFEETVEEPSEQIQTNTSIQQRKRLRKRKYRQTFSPRP